MATDAPPALRPSFPPARDPARQGRAAPETAVGLQKCSRSCSRQRRPVPAVFRALVLTAALAAALCLPGPKALAASLFTCPEGRRVLIPGPENSQIARIFEALARGFEAADNGRVEISHHPGRGGSYALRDLGREKADGCAQAGLVLPSFFYLEASPDSMTARGDIAFSAIAAQSANALWAAEDGPHASLEDFLAHARRVGRDPAEYFFIAGTGSYTDQHMATLQFNRLAGIRAEYAPLLGSAEAVRAVRDGKAAACWGYALAPDSMPGMRPLAVAAERRSPALPDTPTFRELGLDFINTVHFAFGIPGNSPADRLAALRAAAWTDRSQSAPPPPGLEALAPRPETLPVLASRIEHQAEADLHEYPLLPGMSPRPVAP